MVGERLSLTLVFSLDCIRIGGFGRGRGRGDRGDRGGRGRGRGRGRGGDKVSCCGKKHRHDDDDDVIRKERGRISLSPVSGD